jgi:integrase
MKIKGLYEKRGWWYYQPPTNTNGVRPKAIALRTKDPQEAIDLSFTEMERIQLVAAAVDGRMAQAIEQYLQAKLALRKHGPKTSYSTGKALRQICQELGNPKLNELTEKKIEDWAKDLSARKCRVAIRGSKKLKRTSGIKERAGTSVSDSTVAAYARMFRAFLNWLHANGKILRNVKNAAPSGKSKKTRKMRFTSFAERDLILDTAPNPDIAFIVHLGFLAGLRFGEILAMQPDWLWFHETKEEGSIRIQETKFWKPKDREARDVPMPPRLVRFLKQWPKEGEFLLRPEKDVFPAPPEYRYNPKVSFGKHATKCGVPWLSYHDMRHSYGAHLIQRKATLAELAKLLGDELSVVEKHYAGLMEARHNLAQLL